MCEDDYFLFFFLAEILMLIDSKYKSPTFYIDCTLWLCYKILNQLCVVNSLSELSDELDLNSWVLVLISFCLSYPLLRKEKESTKS